MSAFWHAAAFLTRLPVPKELDGGAWAKSPPWYPVIGLILGGLLAGTAWLLGFIAPPMVVAMLVVTLWVYLTGGLHLDGLMDTADGFWSHRSRERTLEIMKDSRVGAMGVLAALLLLGNKVAVLASLQGEALWGGLLLAPVMGRAAMLGALYWEPYAREDGLAKSLRAVGSWGRVWPFVFAALLGGVGVARLGWGVPVAFLLSGCVFVMVTRAARKKIGGCTGDVYGALCELAETAVLLALVLGGEQA